MTSKEALESWFNAISTNDKIRWEEHYKVIKKDLEVLEILKKKMIIDTDYYDSDVGCEEFEYIAYNGQPLNIENKEEYDLIKEWLENEN